MLHVPEDARYLEGARFVSDGNLCEVPHMKLSQVLEDTLGAREVAGMPINHSATAVSGSDSLSPVVGVTNGRTVSLRAILGDSHLVDGSADLDLRDEQMPGRPCQAFPDTTCFSPVCGGMVGGVGMLHVPGMRLLSST